MNSKHYLALFVAVAIIAGLFYFANKPKPNPPVGESSTGHGAMPAALPEVAAADFDSILVAAKRKLSPTEQAQLSGLENGITRGDVQAQQIKAYESIGQFWRKKNRPVAAHYFGLSGKLENSEKKLNFAAHLYFESFFEEQDAAKRQWMGAEAVKLYERSLELNPDNDTIIVDLAILYIDGLQQTMTGVTLLLELDRKDSTNIPANIILGKMAIESGQLDKAIERGEKVTRLAPDNVEGYLFLGEAYKRHGEKENAIAVFTQAKELMNNPEFAKDIDAYIATF